MSAQAPTPTGSPESLHIPAALGPSPLRPPTPSNIDIEAVIQAATSSGGQLSPSSRDTRTQLFVGNLPYRVRWQDLKDLFRKTGTVLRADVSLGPDNRSRGYGTVLLASAEDAKKAIEMFNGFSWQTRTLEVRSDRIPPDLDLSNPLNALQFSKAQNSSGHVYPFIPPINGAFVNMDPITAQIHARAAAEAQQALGLPVASPIPPSTIPSVHLSPNPSATGAGRMLFVGNLPFHCQWQELKDLFRTAGQIVRADVALGPDGRSRGFGTVLFANEVDAAAAVAMFNGYEYHGRTLKVHHDKFSQGGDPLSPSFTPQSGQSTHALASPIPNLSLGRNVASASLANPSFAHQQLGPHPYSSSGGASSSPLYLSEGQPSSKNQHPHRFLGHPPSLQQHQHQSQNQITKHNPEFHDFAHTPGAPIYHANQRAAYIQHLHSSIASPPPLPLHQPPPPRSGSESKPARPNTAVERTPERADGSTSSTVGSPAAPALNSIAGPSRSATTTKSTSRASELSNGKRGRMGSDSRRPPAPGTISLPPSQMFSVNPMSPQMTRGLPITPSMPAFTFHAPTSTPPLHHHLLSPGLGPYSPPITFFNPYLNPAPGAPLHTGGQQQAHQPMFSGGNSTLRPQSSLHDQLQASPASHPIPAGSEYFEMPGSPYMPTNHAFPPPPLMPTVSQQQMAAQTLPEPTDYFAGVLPTNTTSLPPDLPPARTSSNEGIGGAGQESGGTGPSTIPSSSGASSPLGSRQGAASSRGTSNPGEGDDLVMNVDSPPPGTVEHRILHRDMSASSVPHGRAKSQSPNDSTPSLTLGQHIADNAESPLGERRMSWNDFSGLQRSIARMSLEGSRDAAQIGKR